MLADKIGVTFQQVQKYEEGANGARGSRLVQIAKALDIPIGELFKGAGIAGRTTPVTELSNLVTSQYALRMLRALSKIERPASQRALVKLAEEIASERGHLLLPRYFLNGPRRPNLPLTGVESVSSLSNTIRGTRFSQCLKYFRAPSIRSQSATSQLTLNHLSALSDYLQLIGARSNNTWKCCYTPSIGMISVQGRLKSPTTSFRLKCLLFKQWYGEHPHFKITHEAANAICIGLKKANKSRVFLTHPAFRVFLKALLPKFTY